MNDKIKKIVSTKNLLVVLSIVIFALFFFWIGEEVGSRRAEFNERFGDNYVKVFRDSNGRGGFMRNEMFGGHGAYGKIISINPQIITISGDDNIEKAVLITDDTLIRQYDQNIKITDLTPGENVYILGRPNNSGQIEARIIRVIPDNNQ